MKNAVSILVCLAAMLPVMAQTRVLTLEECKGLAVQNDPNEKNARLDLLSAKAMKGEALSAYFPSVAATAGAFHAYKPIVDVGITDIFGTSPSAMIINDLYNKITAQAGLPNRFQFLNHGYIAGVNLIQPVFAGGRIVNGNRLASLGIKAAELKQSLQHRNTDEQIEKNYWFVVSLQEKQKILDSAFETLNSLDKAASAALAAGLVTESDMMQLNLKISELRSKEIQLKGGIRLTKMNLLNSISVPFALVSAAADSSRIFIDDIVLAGLSDDLLSPDRYYVDENKLASQMEESKLLQLLVEARGLQKKMVVGEALPEIGVGAAYGYNKLFTDGRANGSLYGMVKIPITDWARTAEKIKRSNYELQKARNTQEYYDSQLVLRASQLWISLNTAWEQLQLAEESVNYAQDVFDRQREQYAAGLVTMSELLQTQTSLRKSEDECIDSRIAYKSALNSYLLCRGYTRRP